MTVTSAGFSVAVGLLQHVEAFGVRNPPGVLDAVAERKIPGSFLPGIFLDSCQTFGIRSYAERERSS